MPSFHLRTSAPHPCAKRLPDNLLRPLFSFSQNLHFKQNMLQLNHPYYLVKEASLSCSVACPLTNQPDRFFQSTVHADETSELRSYESEILMNSTHRKKNLIDREQMDNLCNSNGCLNNEQLKERERRRKIGLGNKGRVPWNKGGKHTQETRLLIKKRTIEALKDPKVRKKMTEHPHPHTDQTKEKIRYSLRHVWSKRSKRKKLVEKFFVLWSRNIAEAAKIGGTNQEDLEWDSYDKLGQEIALEQLQWAVEKSRAKEICRLRLERERKAQKLAVVARKKEREEEVGRRELKKRLKMEKKTNRKSEHSQAVKLKKRLTKICKRKPTKANRQVAIKTDGATSCIPPLEHLDIELIKRERKQREVSLAEQIREAKSRRRIRTGGCSSLRCT